jgi:hypothetical protein
MAFLRHVACGTFSPMRRRHASGFPGLPLAATENLDQAICRNIAADRSRHVERASPRQIAFGIVTVAWND